MLLQVNFLLPLMLRCPITVLEYYKIKTIITASRRLCAVFGGVYCLKRQLDGVVIDNDKCKAVISGKQRLTLEHLVVGQGHLPPEIVASEGEQRISRGIFITDR